MFQGKGKQMTYWLTGKEGFNQPLPCPDDEHLWNS